MVKVTKRNVNKDYVDYEVVYLATIVRMTLNRKRGALTVKSKGNYEDESWDESYMLSCDRLSRIGIKHFADYVASVLGFDIWNVIDNDVPND